MDAFHNHHRSALAKLDVIIKEQNIDRIILMGDFNADPKKERFLKKVNWFYKLFISRRFR